MEMQPDQVNCNPSSKQRFLPSEVQENDEFCFFLEIYFER